MGCLKIFRVEGKKANGFRLSPSLEWFIELHFAAKKRRSLEKNNICLQMTKMLPVNSTHNNQDIVTKPKLSETLNINK